MAQKAPKAKPIVIGFCGDSSVGKTALYTRLGKGIFSTTVPTISSDTIVNKITVEGQVHTVQFIDTAGQESFRSQTLSYIRNVQTILFCFDISSKNSFNSIQYWVDTYEQNHINRKIPVRMLLGCKSDLAKNRQVSLEEAKALADKNELTYLECSAKTEDGLKDFVKNLVMKFKAQNPTLVNFGVDAKATSELSQKTQEDAILNITKQPAQTPTGAGQAQNAAESQCC
ncbi:ehrabx6d protein, putative [Entamoeba invadens IP1]|uniref:Ehrabx6d protein, putative n=1 Tax=Entamoeba invadens IP1 TaxID=370355 RepID=A0A0A1U681_ENTIV|nr:ehrabx6d protein, putative [Entamoeba invadens IP1]ELP87341.1 ehrabx6d protein, putative [Entamoeba invadens IP1]|eukprot:XP_004254112.1 ehrabx6d protein, putative [Entamoeba invadens IP1]